MRKKALIDGAAVDGRGDEIGGALVEVAEDGVVEAIVPEFPVQLVGEPCRSAVVRLFDQAPVGLIPVQLGVRQLEGRARIGANLQHILIALCQWRGAVDPLRQQDAADADAQARIAKNGLSVKPLVYGTLCSSHSTRVSSG